MDEIIEKKETEQKDDRTLTVGQYLDALNSTLKHAKARIQGEVSGIQEYPGRSYLYFSIKDTETDATAKCFMWKNDYRTSGVTLAEGMEAIITAFPQVYKPSGSMTLQVSMVELVGEGALKIAYEKLKRQLESEGLFDPSRKRAIPEFPHRIGVITSKSGAVINDFLSNIGKYGYEILFKDSRVEGALAVPDLLAALRVMYTQKVDVLVLMRGGGSLESFQAFNNESIVRAVSKFNAPVITGIGHDKDIPLVSLISDVNVSTPTAVTHILNQSWRDARAMVDHYALRMTTGFTGAIRDEEFRLARAHTTIEDSFSRIFQLFGQYEHSISLFIDRLSHTVDSLSHTLTLARQSIVSSFDRSIEKSEEVCTVAERVLSWGDPTRALARGYSIIRSGGKVIKRVEDAPQGSRLDITLSDGTIHTNVI